MPQGDPIPEEPTHADPSLTFASARKAKGRELELSTLLIAVRFVPTLRRLF